MNGQKQNNINELAPLSTYRLENLFSIYKNNSDKYFYNLLNTVNIPDDLDPAFFTTYRVPSDNVPWTLISYVNYGTPELWWLICSTNKINNPINFAVGGQQLKILVPEIVSNILASIKNS